MQPKLPEKTLLGTVVAARLDENHPFLEALSPAMQALKRIIADVAATDIPVLLVGESGTGKEVMALEIHRLSRRQNEPFTKMSCGVLTVSSLNEWLEGSENGDGANRPSRPGTVLLDEISELDLTCQSKLLHALPDGDALPQAGRLTVRMISSSSRNLEAEMQAGRFRQELYYRIEGVCLRLPPLRQRKEDIPGLVAHFLTKYAALFGRPQPSLDSQSLQILLDHSWPGNIRELENVVKKIVIVGEERTAVGDLGPSRGESPFRTGVAEGVSLKQAARKAAREAERELILKALTRTRWNRKRAALELQISYKALLYKLKQVGLDNPAALQD